MDIKKIQEKINKDREKVEACFVMCLWKDLSLYDDYQFINEGKDKTLKNEDAKFYFLLGKSLRKMGVNTADNITLETFLSNKPKIKEKFEEYGGWRELENLRNLVNTNNLDSYFDEILRRNNLETILLKYEELFEDVERFNNSSSEDVYNTFQLLNDSVAVSNTDTKIENLLVDKAFIDDCNSGQELGLDYSESCPILSRLTLGLPLGEMYMIGGHSGVGKSSWVFENLVLPIAARGVKVGIISNEMRSKAYKLLLLVHILTKDMDYWDLTRKKLKTGSFTNEQYSKLMEASKLSELYSNISFVKMFNNDITQVTKYMKKLAAQGIQCIIFDTMKSDDEQDEAIWQSLMKNSRKIFNIASKYNISIVPTYQLALTTENQRYLSANCLSNSKQVKEVFSEMVYMRLLWSDEYPGQKYDCHPYTLVKTESGKYIRKEYKLEKKEGIKHIVAFLDKTRNDEDKQQVLFEWNPRFNKWTEVARCNVINEHKNNF